MVMGLVEEGGGGLWSRGSRTDCTGRPLALAGVKESVKLAAACAVVGATYFSDPAFADGCRGTVDALLGDTQGLRFSVATAVLWNGAIVTAFTTAAQSFGQGAVRPTVANTIYASQPVWSAIFAWALLGEVMPATERIGAALLLTGAVLAARTPGAAVD